MHLETILVRLSEELTVLADQVDTKGNLLDAQPSLLPRWSALLHVFFVAVTCLQHQDSPTGNSSDFLSALEHASVHIARRLLTHTCWRLRQICLEALIPTTCLKSQTRLLMLHLRHHFPQVLSALTCPEHVDLGRSGLKFISAMFAALPPGLAGGMLQLVLPLMVSRLPYDSITVLPAILGLANLVPEAFRVQLQQLDASLKLSLQHAMLQHEQQAAQSRSRELEKQRVVQQEKEKGKKGKKKKKGKADPEEMGIDFGKF